MENESILGRQPTKSKQKKENIMKNFEKVIESLKRLGSQTTISLVDYAKLVDCACEEFGREKVMNALSYEANGGDNQ